MQPSLLDSSVFVAPEFQATNQTVLAFAMLLRVSAAIIALSPGIACAHAIVVAAQPAMNSTVAQGELEIRLDFNSQIDRKRSRLSLQRPDGSESVIALAPDGPAGVLAGRALEAALAGSFARRPHNAGRGEVLRARA